MEEAQVNLPSGFMHNLLDQTTNVTIPFGKVERTEGSRGDPVLLVGLENATTLTLVTNDCGGRPRLVRT